MRKKGLPFHLRQIVAMRLSTRLTIGMVGLVVLTATAIGWFTRENIARALLPDALERMGMEARLRANELASYVESARADVLGFRSAAALDGIVRARLNGGTHPLDGTAEAVWRARMASRYAAELALKPAYLQFRIIGVADGGREIVRVDRSGTNGAVRIVPDDEMQPKGDRDYVEETLRLPPGAVYVSPIDLNREHGVIETPHVPVLRVATPVRTQDGAPFGIVIINLDMRSALARIRANMGPDENFYLINRRGDFLLHPDPNREFGFDLGVSHRIQDQIPELAWARTAAAVEARLVSDAAGRQFGVAVVPVSMAGSLPVTVIETAPYAAIMAPAEAVQRATLLIGFAAVLGAIGVAALLARSLAGPLMQMTSAVQAFARGEPIAVPTKAAAEIGVLARAFADMARDVRDKAAQLGHEASERERVLAALSESLVRQQAIFTSSPIGILTLNESGSIESLNPAAERMFDCTAEAVMRRDIGRLIELGGSNDVSSASSLRQLASAGGAGEFAGRSDAGPDFPIEVAITQMPIGDRLMFVVFVRDLRDRQIAEEKFRLVVESSPSGMIMTDADGTMLMVNAETEKLFGFERAELIGQSVDILVPARLREGHLQQRRHFGAHPKARPMTARRELCGRRKDGTEFPVEIGLNPIRMRDALHILSVVIDISEHKRIERMKDEFVATVSHELRTPLTSIAGSLGLLIGGAAGSLPTPAKRLMSIAYTNSQRLVRLINDILDLEKIESGKITFALQQVDILGIVEQAVEANRGFADSYGSRLLLDPGSDTCLVHADIDRMIQVVTNLLSNAIKFSPAGGEVVVAIARHGDVVRVSVRDHGTGIPDEFKSHIFEKFAQADSSDSRKKGGTGLGLNIARQIVVQHGGTLAFDRAPGGGTVFYFDLPRFVAHGEAKPPGGGDRSCVMLCDDDPDVCEALTARLQAAGFAVATAPTAAAALKRAAETPPVAFLIDLTLPDSDGISLIQQLQTDPRHAGTPTIVISADSERGRTDLQSSALNVLAWIDKPIDVAHLVRVIDRATVESGRRPHVLHVDDDRDVLHVVAEALRAEAEVTSAGSLDEARRALAAGRFDLAVLDLALADGFGLDLLPDLHDRNGDAVPVVVFSAQDKNSVVADRVEAMLTKSRTSIDGLVCILRRIVASKTGPRHDKEVA
jgi:PAS domain S-box-containing protein